MKPKVSKPLSGSTKMLLSLTSEQRTELFNKMSNDLGESVIVDSDNVEDNAMQDTAGQLSIGRILFDNKTKNFVKIDFARKDPDYVYHISFSKKKAQIPSDEIIRTIAKATCDIKPEGIEAVLKLPMSIPMENEVYEIDCHTLIVKKVSHLPGSRKIMEDILVSRLLDDLDILYKKY